jgi:hypothetical protein
VNGFMNSSLYIEIGHGSLKVLNGNEGLELPLERLSSGRLTDSCKEKLSAGLQRFLKRKSWQPRTRAFCAINARGVSLRRLTLPAAAKEEWERLLRMQIESEFPLAPDELAWGYRLLGESRQNGATRKDVLVVAVKKDVVDDYSSLLSGCGISPIFTLAALARNGICPHPRGTYALLDLGNQTAELILFEDGIPTSVRILQAGTETLNLPSTLDLVANSLPTNGTTRTLFVAGIDQNARDTLRLVERLGSNIDCQPLKIEPGEGRSAATLGLRRSTEADGNPLLMFQSKQANGKASLASPSFLKWAACAGALVLILLLLPYAEALLLKPWLTRKYSELKADTGRLGTIDRELGFLQFLKQNQPPYLDALYLFSKSTPQGARMDSLTMNRRGEVSMRGSMRNSDQVADFRNKLMDSGFFSSVSVEEQTPTPDRQKVNIRISAQWKPASALQLLAIGPTAAEIEKSRNRKEPSGGMPGSPPGLPNPMPKGAGGMPPGLPPGVQLPPGPVPVMPVPVPERK